MADPNVMVDDGTGTLRRAQLVAQASGDIVYPENEKSTNVQVRGADGKLHRAQLVAMIGGGGGSDQHNLGYYATVAELEEAHPTAEAGDWAIVAESDTVYIWDDAQQAWVDTDRKGQVESVNGKTGAVVLNASDVGALSATPYEYTAELEFTPNVDSEGAIIIELAADNVATLQIGQYVSYEDGGVWDDPVEDAVYTAFMQPSLDTSVGASKILWTSPGNRLIWMEGYAGTGQNEQSILTLKYQYNESGLAEDHCKIVLKIISDKELTITTTKDPSEFVMDIGAGIMSLPIPLYEEDDQGRFYPVQQGGIITWEPIPEVESLPSQTGQSGKFLTTDGTDASWSDKPLVNKATGNRALCIGDASSSGNFSIVIDQIGGSSTGSEAINIGTQTRQNAKNLLIGASKANMPMGCVFLNAANAPTYINFGIGEFWVGVSNTMYGLYYKVMDVSGHIPTARLTKVNTTITLAAADWSSNTQTVNVTGMTADGVVMVSPAPTDQSAYTSAGILCTAQAAGTLTFTCDTVPSADLSVNIVML